MATHFYLNGHTYELESALQSWAEAKVNADTLTWDDGGTLGKTIPAYLAEISLVAENEIILKNVKASLPKGRSVASDGGGADYLWIGGSDEAVEGTWQWATSATLLSAGYQNWGRAEPDDALGLQDHLAFARLDWPLSTGASGAAGQWNDLDGSNQLWSVIEWDGLVGTEANDRLTGTSGDDIIDGGAGDDAIKAGAGNDTIYMGAGDDKVYADEGDNTIVADTGVEDSEDGNDSIVAKSGDDVIWSGAGNDTINAGDGDNEVLTGTGKDTIRTGSGDDTINAGDGLDIIKGGSGSDVFILDNLAEEGFDTIKDFDAGVSGGTQDKIRLDSAVFTALAGGVEPTFFVKGSGMTGASSNETGVDDYLIFDTHTGNLFYDEDGHNEEVAAVLVAILKGRVKDLNFEDFEVY